MIPNAVSAIRKTHIDALVTDGIPEDRELDYKRELQVGGDRRIGFLKDVAALANTLGGDLVFGVEEETDSTGKRTGKAAAVLGLPDFNDITKLKLEQWIRTGVEPRVYVQFHEIVGYAEGPVLVVRVQRSWTGPHMVKGDYRFWARGNSGNYEMDAAQVRAAVLQSQSVTERVTNFCRERTNLIQKGEVSPKLLLGSTMILHVVPISGLSGNDIDLQLAKGAVLPPGGGGNSRFNLDGWMVVEPGGQHGRSAAYVQVFRNGTVEGVRCYGDKEVIPGLSMMEDLNASLAQYLQAVRRFGLPPPYSVFLTIVGVKNRYIAIGHGPGAALDRDVLALPDLWLEEADCHKPIGTVWQPAFDALAQATGLERCPHYNSQNEWTAGG